MFFAVISKSKKRKIILFSLILFCIVLLQTQKKEAMMNHACVHVSGCVKWNAAVWEGKVCVGGGGSSQFARGDPRLIHHSFVIADKTQSGVRGCGLSLSRRFFPSLNVTLQKLSQYLPPP